jgi:hypothetical protein
MAISVPATINQSGTVTGFTSATWATAAASQNVPNGRLWVVTGKGGTQPSAVDVHSASRPFSILAVSPQSIQTLPALNNSGVLPNVPVNVHNLSIRKGLTVLSGQPSVPGYVRLTAGIPAGADLADPDNVAAMYLAMASLCVQIAQGVIDTYKTGTI